MPGCRWTSISAASSTRSCTCCTAASSPARMRDDRASEPGGALRRALHPGHGHARELSGRRGPLALPGGGRVQPGAGRQPQRDAEGGEPRRPSAGSRRCRSRSATPSIPAPSSTNTAPTPRAGSSCATTRPSGTWSGPRAGVAGAYRFTQRIYRLTAAALAGLPPAGTSAAGAAGEAKQAAPGDAPDHRRGDRGAGQLRLQRRRRPHPRIRQCHRRCRGRGGGDWARRSARRWRR